MNERALWRGKRIDNGEWVEGYIVFMPNTSTVKISRWCKSYMYLGVGKQEFDVFEVDPETVEPVAVKVVERKANTTTKVICPNCDRHITQYIDTMHRKKFECVKYCSGCGQRLDWSE